MADSTTMTSHAKAATDQHGACGYSPSDVTSPLHPRRRRGDRGRWCSSIPRRRRGGRVLLLPRVQLRGLARRHRQPGAPPRRPRCPRTPPPVRPDLLPPRHRPRFRRQDRHRLHRGGAGAAAPDAVPRRRERRRLPARRELRSGRRDGAGRRVLRAPGAEVRAGLPRHRDGLVQGTLAASWLISSRAKEDHGELALRRRRDGRQRLPQRHLPEPDSRRGQDLRSRHRRRRPFISHRVDRGWSEDGVGPGDAADRLRAAASRALQARPLRWRLRRRHQLPDEPQRARRAAQPRAHLRHRRAPPRPPRHGHRLRRPLPRRHRHRRLAAQIRVQRRAAVRVLWRRRGPVQRGVGGEVRRRGDGGVRRAIGVRVLGRDTLHGGGQQGDRAWHRARAVHHATDIVVRIFEQLKKYARNLEGFYGF